MIPLSVSNNETDRLNQLISNKLSTSIFWTNYDKRPVVNNYYVFFCLYSYQLLFIEFPFNVNRQSSLILVNITILRKLPESYREV